MKSKMDDETKFNANVIQVDGELAQNSNPRHFHLRTFSKNTQLRLVRSDKGEARFLGLKITLPTSATSFFGGKDS